MAGADPGPAPFVDGHVHFWELDNPVLDYGILAGRERHPILGDIDGLRVRRFGPEEFRAAARFSNVSKVVHVQVAFGRTDPIDETAWLTKLADLTGLPDAIVGFEDLAAPDVADRLAAHAAHPLLRGLRGFDDAETLRSRNWRRGYGLLERHRLVYGHCFGVGMFDAARELAEAFDSTILCVDQAGLPLSRTPEYFAAWEAGLKLAAGAPNTVCKVSSLGMVDQRWTVDSLRPWVLACVEAFGPDRVFFGSNFPMDQVASSYPDLVGAFRQIIAPFTPDERSAMLSGNATRLYRL
jgi:predicted TIM-barrel fold metal-dependent hydrolase